MVQPKLAVWLQHVVPGIAYAVSSSALAAGRVPDTAITRAVLKNYQASRSGDIYIVFSPNVFINDFDGLQVASTHGSPWQYDTFVPIVFAGAIGDQLYEVMNR